MLLKDKINDAIGTSGPDNIPQKTQASYGQLSTQIVKLYDYTFLSFFGKQHVLFKILPISAKTTQEQPDPCFYFLPYPDVLTLNGSKSKKRYQLKKPPF